MDPSETTSTTSTTCPSPLLAAAAQRRIASVPKVADDAGLQHERRQHFRRLVDPGIRRPNSSGDALAAIEMLSTIADNILREPDNPKYHRFKPTNPRIKKALVETKGALEYAVELGFRAEVHDLQPYYVFHTKRMEDLRVGAAILHDAMNNIANEQERRKCSPTDSKAAARTVARNTMLAFHDDRKTVASRCERERARLEAQQQQQSGSSVNGEEIPGDSVASTSSDAAVVDDDDETQQD